ncbi:uncharacterized protein LOC119679382 isoform X1 [Teleopsis dalmanni]|uniref:uncharacterized protein LOC119679382 isoform X1 n=2 Tax=Teleopsis dalmanni TaxID=139649 RepID=UPI0018CF5132|nr:uncharacterized protein LOC119679382 isoform X1 [Teleopsis dalmanni]
MNEFFLNDTALRKLLSSWKCQVLASHIEEEGIDIEELTMMKTEHMTELLRNYRLGIRIRFEHYFEKWRRSINQPITKNSANSVNITPYGSTINELQYGKENTSTLRSEAVSIGVNTDPYSLPISGNNTISRTNESVSIGVNTDPMELNTISINSLPPNSVPIPVNKATTLTNGNIVNRVVDEVPKFIWFKKKRKVFGSSGFSVLNILKFSGRMDILASYEKYGILSREERSTLINVIAKYLIEHNQKLSLKGSYDLEFQIRHVFPNELLIYYRSGRLGRIYKRYLELQKLKKRKNVNKIKSCEPSVNDDCNLDDNMTESSNLCSENFAQNFESCSNATDLFEVEIKNEIDLPNLSSEDFAQNSESCTNATDLFEVEIKNEIDLPETNDDINFENNEL